MLTRSRTSGSGLLSAHSHARPSSRVLIAFLTSALFVSVIILSGCAGVTGAKSNSATSTNGTEPLPTGVLSGSPAAVNFGKVFEGGTSNQSLTITNAGASPVTISQASASGAGFSIGGVTFPVSLRPGTSATFTASFTPTSTGNVSGAASFSGAQLG